MHIELPDNYNCCHAEIKDGILLVYTLIRFEYLMYELTYILKGNTCVYCGKNLTEKNGTLDHRYPRETGGMSITNNLFPCCRSCNKKKSTSTHEEFLSFKELSKTSIGEAKKYLHHAIKTNSIHTKEFGFNLPQKWVTFENTNDIMVKGSLSPFRGKTYDKIKKSYKAHDKLPRPAVLDRNNVLLDGYNVVLFASDYGINQIPVIKLENVELLIE